MIIKEDLGDVVRIQFNDNSTLTIIGTAHISQGSIDTVQNEIDALNPDCIAIELDEQRWKKSHDEQDIKQKAEQFDLIKVIKDGKFFMLIASLVLSSFQKRMSKNTTAGKVGGEIIGAGDLAKERGINLVLADRDISITLKRAWGHSSLWTKCKLIASLLASIFDHSEVKESELEQLKENDNISKMLEDLSHEMPTIKTVLIDERDMYLAGKIYKAEGQNKVAVIGKGHMKGLLNNLEKLDANEKEVDLDTLNITKSRKLGFWDYTIFILLVAVFMIIGITKGAKLGLKAFIVWAICCGATSCFGAIITLAHPLTWLVTVVTAPISALAPVLGVGMFSAVTQASVCRTRVKDLDNLQDDLTKPKKWFKNRILHTFLIFVVTSLLSGAGTFILFPIALKHFVG